MELLTTMVSDSSGINSGRPRSRRGSLSPHELSMSLRSLGFNTWKDLEPGRLNLSNYCIENNIIFNMAQIEIFLIFLVSGAP